MLSLLCSDLHLQHSLKCFLAEGGKNKKKQMLTCGRLVQLMASLVDLDQAVQVEALTRDIALCS